MSFKIAADKAQAKARRIINNDLGDFDDLPTLEQERENLVKRKQWLDKEIIKYPKFSTHRRSLGAELRSVDDRINAIKKKFIAPRNFENFICDVIKLEVTRVQWNIWVNKAKIEYEKQQPQQEEK